MKSFFLIFFFSILLSAPPHDIPMGIFSLTFEQEQIRMDIKLEVEDIEKAVALHFKQKSNDRLVEQYILKHTDWSINGQTLNPELCSTEKQEDHYLIKMNFDTPSYPLTTMTIVNECLLQEIDNQSNIIYINQYGEQRGFRLHKDRKETTFELM